MLGALQQKMEEVKKQLDQITVKQEAAGSGLTVEMTANRKLVSVSIPEDLMVDREQLEELLVIAFNKASEAAEKASEQHMAAAAKDLLPGMGNLFGM